MPITKLILNTQEVGELELIILFSLNYKPVKLDIIVHDAQSLASSIIIQITPLLLGQNIFENLFCDV